MMRFTRSSVLVLLVLSAAACSDGQGVDTVETDEIVSEQGELLGISIRPKDPSITTGQQANLIVKAYYDDNTSAVIDDVTWSSTNEAVVSVSGGSIEGLRPGSADIIATEPSGKSAKVEVTVRGEDVTPVSLSIQPSSFETRVGDLTQLSADVTFSDDSVGGVTGCVWSSSDTSIASVDAQGALSAAAEGSVQVAAECQGLSDEITVTVVGAEEELGQCDLIVAEILTYVEGSSLEVLASIQNQGDGLCEGGLVDVDLFVDTPPTSGNEVDYAPVASLAPGDSDLVLLYADDLSNGGHEILVYVDSLDQVAESDEDNNIAGVNIVVDAAEQANLVIDSVDWIADGSETLYEVTITNEGPGIAYDFFIDLWLDEASAPADCLALLSDHTDLIGQLGAGESYTWLVEEYSSPGAGEAWTTQVMVDPCGDVDESDETDNIVEVTVDGVAPADQPNLYVDSITVIADTSSAIYEIVLANDGTADASGVDVDLWLDRSSDPLCSDGYGDEGAVVNISAGSTYTWEVEVNSGPSTGSSWLSYVVLDVCDNIAESDESDNIATESVVPF